MAAGALNVPGTVYGPCIDTCAHRDCAATRKMAAASCVYCGDPIGYDTEFFNVTLPDQTPWSKLAHASCEYAETEALQSHVAT